MHTTDRFTLTVSARGIERVEFGAGFDGDDWPALVATANAVAAALPAPGPFCSVCDRLAELHEWPVTAGHSFTPAGDR